MTDYRNMNEKQRDIVNLTRLILYISDVPVGVYSNDFYALTQINTIVSTILALRDTDWGDKEVEEQK